MTKPSIERRKDHRTRDRIDELTESVEKSLTWMWRTIGVLAVGMMLALVGAGYLIGQNSDRSHDIQDQRKDSIYSSCVEQNDRHDSTIDALNKLVAERIKKHPDEAERARDSQTGSVLLINALVPKRNCPLRVKKLVPNDA